MRVLKALSPELLRNYKLFGLKSELRSDRFNSGKL